LKLTISAAPEKCKIILAEKTSGLLVIYNTVLSDTEIKRNLTEESVSMQTGFVWLKTNSVVGFHEQGK
jgi:hypothetical protein